MITQIEKQEIVAVLQSGNATYSELSQKYGVGATYIGQIYRKKTGTYFRPIKRLSRSEKETIVAEIQAKKASMEQLAKRYGVRSNRISMVYKKMTGSALHPHTAQNTEAHPANEQERKRKLAIAVQESRYRAWQSREKRMYTVLGVDWFEQKILIPRQQTTIWVDLKLFTLMQYSGLRNHQQTPKYPKGREICVGDIIQFPINLSGSDGKTTETIVTDMVIFNSDKGMFTLTGLHDYDPLALYNDECEVIGTIYENPELISEATEIAG